MTHHAPIGPRRTTQLAEPFDSQTALLSVESVRRWYRVRQQFRTSRVYARAVDGVSLEIRSGSTFTLVGESGSGKTTLAKMVLGLERPDSGRIVLDGNAITGTRIGSGHRSDIQAVFQNPWKSFDPRMRVGRAIAEAMESSGRFSRSEIADRVDSLLEDVGLSKEASQRLPRQFSGGQRQRLAIARALAPQPRLVVLDEPVSALDVSVRAQIMNLLRDTQEAYGLTYLMIAHDLATVRYLSDDLAVMYLGRIVESGPSEELFRRSRHPYTRSLIDAAIPLTTRDTEPLLLEGELPSPIQPPMGCRLRSRCWLYKRLGRPELCSEVEPSLATSDGMNQRHVTACHFSSELMGQTAGTV